MPECAEKNFEQTEAKRAALEKANTERDYQGKRCLKKSPQPESGAEKYDAEWEEPESSLPKGLKAIARIIVLCTCPVYQAEVIRSGQWFDNGLKLRFTAHLNRFDASSRNLFPAKQPTHGLFAMRLHDST